MLLLLAMACCCGCFACFLGKWEDAWDASEMQVS
jgi:hypothetical protein